MASPAALMLKGYAPIQFDNWKWKASRQREPHQLHFAQQHKMFPQILKNKHVSQLFEKYKVHTAESVCMLNSGTAILK